MTIHLNLGGLVAAGFDETGRYLLTVSHDGRGVYATGGWQKLSRDRSAAYPEAGRVAGIGAIAGQSIRVVEKDRDTGQLSLSSPDGKWCLAYEDGVLSVSECGCS